jgi:hypothetical protein
MGYPAQTLLCETIDVEKGVMPVASDVFDDLLFNATVTFDMVYFDPTDGVASDGLYGHNLFPYGSDRTFYGARLNGTVGTGKPLFDTTVGQSAFANAFAYQGS